MSFKCVPIYGLMFRILTRFHALYFGASCIHRNSIVWRRVNLARFPYWPEKRKRKDFAVLVFNENAHFQWIWSDNFWSRDSAPPMAVGEKHRLYNKCIYWLIPLAYSYPSIDLFSHSFVRSIIHENILKFIHASHWSFVNSFIHVFVHSIVHLFDLLFVYLFFFHLFIRSFIHTVIHK